MAPPSSPPLVVAVVGTDHHPFERLVRWVDGWAADRGARVVIQHGSAPAPRHAEGHQLLGAGELSALLRDATAAVCHGGPGTIAAVREAGLRPIVVARHPDLGEHVDDHQVRFVARLAAGGDVCAPADEDELRRLLDAGLEDPATLRLDAPAGRPEEEASRRLRSLVGRFLQGSGSGPRVLYIAGWGRSGSTLLDRMLGQVPGVCSTGEVRDIWQRGGIENRLCGCGAPFRDCEVWRAVGESAFGGWDQLDLAAMQDLRLRLDRPWSPPRVLGSKLTPDLDADVVRYVEHLGRLYRAIAEVTGARLIVDSSKIPTYALLLRQIEGIDLRVLHLVRDPRGVVFSWQKQVVRADGGGRDEMVRYASASASARYAYYNVLSRGLRTLGLPYRLLRYEDLLAAPRAVVARVLAFGGIATPGDTLAFLRDAEADLGPNHTVDGNPMRLQQGPVLLRADDAWRREMAPARRAMVSVLTAPLLAAYGYPVRG